MTTLRTRSLTLALTACLATAAAAPAALVQFTGKGGGEWSKAENWDPSAPTASDTAYFGYRMGKDEATVTVTENAAAKNLTGDANGPSLVVIDLGGNTLELSNQSDIKSPIAFRNGEVTLTNQFAIKDGGKLIAGEEATIRATGATNSVQVEDGGALEIAGGRIEENSGKRDLAAASGATVHFAGAGSVAARSAELQDGSVLRYTLPAEAWDEAPLQLHENVNNLGELQVATAAGYTHTPGTEYPLISYPRGVVNDTFSNAAEGATVTSEGGHKFQLTYEGVGGVTLTALE